MKVRELVNYVRICGHIRVITYEDNNCIDVIPYVRDFSTIIEHKDYKDKNVVAINPSLGDVYNFGQWEKEAMLDVIIATYERGGAQ